MQVEPKEEPAWGFGLTEPRTLLEFRRYDAVNAPIWCRQPDTLLEQLSRAVPDRVGDFGVGCTAKLEDSVLTGRLLEITCPLGSGSSHCGDTYLGQVWGNRYDDAPANYALYGFGWVRRACEGSAGDFNPPRAVADSARRSSQALERFLDQCR